MDLTPRHIQEKQFHDAFRGYSHEEVDMFLDDVADAFERVFRENQTLHHQLRQIEEHLSEARGSEDMLKRMLLTAQKTAEEAIEEARTKAQGMVVAAERKAQEVIANAERRAQEIVAEANTKEQELQVNLEGLKRFDSEYRARLKAFIESQLRVLAEGPVTSRGPATETPAVTAQAVSAPAASPGTASPRATERPPAEPPSEKPSPQRTEESAPSGKPSAQPSREPQAPATISVGVGGSRSDTSRTGGAAAQSGPPSRERERRQNGPEPADEEDDEDRSIKELFWGDE